MPRIALRRLLPLLQLALFFELLVVAALKWRADNAAWDAPFPGRPPEFFFETLPRDVCLALNAPPAILAFYIVLALRAVLPGLSGLGYVVTGLAAVGTPFFWYRIGFWFDRQLDWGSGEALRSTGLFHRISGWWTFLACVGFSSGILLWLLDGHPPVRVVMLSLAVWSGMLLLACAVKLRRRRALRRAPTSPLKPQV